MYNYYKNNIKPEADKLGHLLKNECDAGWVRDIDGNWEECAECKDIQKQMDCPYCEGTGIKHTANGLDDYDEEVCDHGASAQHEEDLAVDDAVKEI